MPSLGDPSNGHMANFKFTNRLDIEVLWQARRRRNIASVELRKAKKEDQLWMRRNLTLVQKEVLDLSCEATPPNLSYIDDIGIGMKSPDETIQLQITQICRQLLSRLKHSLIEPMINYGIVPRCVELLNCDHNVTLQFEAAWTLTNVAARTSEQTQVVIKHGAVPRLVMLLKSPSPNVTRQATWALGYIAGDGPTARDLILGHDAMPLLLDLIKPDTAVTFLRNITWTLSNLCRNKNPPPLFDIVKTALSTLYRLLTSPDRDVLVQENALQFFCKLLDTKDWSITTVVLDSMSNILHVAEKMGHIEHIAVIIEENGGLDKLEALQHHENEQIYHKSMAIIDAFFSGDKEQVNLAPAENDG